MQANSSRTYHVLFGAFTRGPRSYPANSIHFPSKNLSTISIVHTKWQGFVNRRFCGFVSPPFRLLINLFCRLFTQLLWYRLMVHLTFHPDILVKVVVTRLYCVPLDAVAASIGQEMVATVWGASCDSCIVLPRPSLPVIIGW